MSVFEFTKMDGCGNDFIVCNYFLEDIFPDPSVLKQKIAFLCERRFGIGADGLISVLPNDQADCQMIIYNRDGSRAEMCGNGLRCAVVYAATHLNISDEACVKTDAGILDVSLSLSTSEVSVKMDFDSSYQTFEFDSFKEVYWIDTGVPHLVVFVPDVQMIDIHQEGAQLRYADAFAPKGTNVNFVQVLSDHEIKIRTYERGVEAETLACGTGATACAYVARAIQKVGQCQHVNVSVKGGDMQILFKDERVYMSGKANVVYKGECHV